jgi:hypothetical protein
MKRKLAISIIVLLSIGTFLLPMSIAWQSNGVPVSTDSSKRENPKICSDGAQGAIIAWEEYRNPAEKDIYAQRVGSTGNILWNTTGVLICSASQEQATLQICSDGFGGAILVWEDYRDFNEDIYAQRIDSMGNCLWTSNGVPIVNVLKYQESPQLCSDGAGGAIIVWVDKRNNDIEDIYAQRITASGHLNWTINGNPICLASSYQRNPTIIADEAGGAIISWGDNRSLDDIYAQKINSAGVTLWSANGTVVCNASNSQWSPELCSDGAGGAIITWEDWRAYPQADVYAQRIGSAGTPQWSANGTAVCTESGAQTAPQICSDNTGGATIGWVDFRNGNDYNIFAYRITQNGQPVWENNETSICNATENQNDLRICSDGTNGAILAWTDARNGTDYTDVYTQRVKADGSVQWQFNGALVSTRATSDSNQKLVNAGVGRAIFTWTGKLVWDGESTDVFANRIPVIIESGDIGLLLLLILIFPIIGVGLALFILYKRREPLE